MIKLTIIGNLGRDAEIRSINQKEYYSLSVATRRRKEEDTLWVQVMYPRRSDGLDGLLRKGRQIYTRGDMQVGVFSRRDGSVEPDVTLWAQELQLLSSSDGGAQAGRREQARPTRQSAPAPAPAPAPEDAPADDLPF